MIDSQKILVIGDVMLDRYWNGSVNRISPEAPVPVIDITHCEDKPGGAANVAKNLSDFGMEVILVGLVGNDEASEKLSQLLVPLDIEFLPIVDSKIRTTLKLRVIDKDKQLIRIDHEDICLSEEINKRFEDIIFYAKDCDGIIISDYDKGVVKPIISKLLDYCKSNNVKTFVDPKGDSFQCYKNSYLFKPNLKEFEMIMGKSTNHKEFLKKGEALYKDLCLEYLLVTEGKNGMTLFSSNKTAHFNALEQDVFDVTGAGDTVISILTASYLSGKDISTSVELANKAASLSVKKLGSTSVTQAELIDV